jgi:ribosomal protein S18 acetylase RimI-like enzyme
VVSIPSLLSGKLAAFCICWIQKVGSNTWGQVESLGVHPDFRNLGLGQSVLAEGLRRLGQKGATSIFVETDNYRDSALSLYRSFGFRVIRDVLVFLKDYDLE